MARGLSARLASGNANKLEELRSALPDWELALVDADAFPPEEGSTYYENARAKARFGRAVSDGWIIGEDSGIEVDALGGRPGIESARWAEDGVAALVQALEGVENRSARYVCELVGISPEQEEFRGTGTLTGTVATDPRGSEGFGYDPIFIPEGETKTVAELGNDWKRTNSHRARATRALLESIGASR